MPVLKEDNSQKQGQQKVDEVDEKVANIKSNHEQHIQIKLYL